MTPDEAKQLLSYHSGRNEDIEHPKWKEGFLGSLRPYQGSLNPDNFHEVMECLRALASSLNAEEQVNRQVINDFIGILHLARAWGIHPDGMLQRNHLITREDTLTLESWLETISYSLMMVLDSEDPGTWFSEYEGS